MAKANRYQEIINHFLNRNEYALKYITAEHNRETSNSRTNAPLVIQRFIDDLFFALYFIIPIKKTGIEQAQNIKTQCLKNQYYQYIH